MVWCHLYRRRGGGEDKHLTEHCWILNNLLPGDVLVDRGFDISESVGLMQARPGIHIPAFAKGKDQLLTLEVEETRAIANVRIHVERVIGAVHQRYSIMKGPLPIDILKKRARRKTNCSYYSCCAF